MFGKLTKTDCFLLFFIVAVAAFFVFYNLSSKSLQSWDEGIYALVSYESLQNKSLTLQLLGEPWFEKPPLGFWIEALSIKMFGFRELAFRLPSALYLFSSIILVYFLGKELFNSYIGFLSSLLTITSPLLLRHHMGRSGDLDTALLLMTVLAFYFLILSRKNKGWFYLSAVAAGLGIMMRGSSGLFIIIISALFLLFSGEDKKIKIRQYIFYSCILALIVLPWHCHQLVVHGSNFYQVYIGDHFFSRIRAPLHNHSGPWSYYFLDMYKQLGLFAVIILISFCYAFYRYLQTRKKELLFLLFWIIITLVPLLLMKTKLYWYMITAIPALMYLVSFSLFDLYKQTKNSPVRKVVAGAGFVLVTGYTLFFSYLSVVYILNTEKDDAERIAIDIYEEVGNEEPLVIYNVLNWYGGRMLPHAIYYFNHIYKFDTYHIGTANLEYYIAGEEFTYFITDNEGRGWLAGVDPVNYSFEEVSSAGSFLLLKKRQIK